MVSPGLLARFHRLAGSRPFQTRDKKHEGLQQEQRDQAANVDECWDFATFRRE